MTSDLDYFLLALPTVVLLFVCVAFAYVLRSVRRELAAVKAFGTAMSVEMNEQRAAAKKKTRFFSQSVHEIRNPLNGVVGHSELLGNTELNAEQREYVNTISMSTEHLLAVINDLLDFERIESGCLVMEYNPLSIALMVEQAIDLSYRQQHHGHLHVAYHVNANIPRLIMGDSVRLRQITSNLLANAFKFCQTGYVVVTVTLDEEKPQFHELTPFNKDGGDDQVLTVDPDTYYNADRLEDAYSLNIDTGVASGATLEHDDKYADDVDKTESSPRKNYVIRVSVEDSGRGIDPQRMHELFQCWHQEARSHTPGLKETGSGLGLVIALRLTGLMGGCMKCESAVNKGSRFSFTFNTREPPLLTSPVKLTSPSTSFNRVNSIDSPTSHQMPSPSHTLTTLHVLVIHNNTHALRLIASTLHDWGCHVYAHIHPQSALKWLKRTPRSERPLIDIAIVDCSAERRGDGSTDELQLSVGSSGLQFVRSLHVMMKQRRISDAVITVPTISVSDEIAFQLSREEQSELFPFGKLRRPLHHSSLLAILNDISANGQRQQPRSPVLELEYDIDTVARGLADSQSSPMNNDISPSIYSTASTVQTDACSPVPSSRSSSGASTPSTSPAMSTYSLTARVLGDSTPPPEHLLLASRYPLRILCAEDDFVGRKLFEALMSKFGYAIHCVDNGIAVLEAIKRNPTRPYDIIFMDMQMPRLGGIDTAKCILAEYGMKQINQNEQRQSEGGVLSASILSAESLDGLLPLFPTESKPARPRIIAVTASALDRDREECLKYMDGYTLKPFTRKRIEQTIIQCANIIKAQQHDNLHESSDLTGDVISD